MSEGKRQVKFYVSQAYVLNQWKRRRKKPSHLKFIRRQWKDSRIIKIQFLWVQKTMFANTQVFLLNNTMIIHRFSLLTPSPYSMKHSSFFAFGLGFFSFSAEKFLVELYLSMRWCEGEFLWLRGFFFWLFQNELS